MILLNLLNSFISPAVAAENIVVATIVPVANRRRNDIAKIKRYHLKICLFILFFSSNNLRFSHIRKRIREETLIDYRDNCSIDTA